MSQDTHHRSMDKENAVTYIQWHITHPLKKIIFVIINMSRLETICKSNKPDTERQRLQEPNEIMITRD